MVQIKTDNFELLLTIHFTNQTIRNLNDLSLDIHSRFNYQFQPNRRLYPLSEDHYKTKNNL